MPNFGNGINRTFRIELFQEFERITKEAQRAVDKMNEHIKENTAHNADNISYQDQTVLKALDILNEKIKTISSDAGQSNTEIVEARTDTNGIAHDTIQERMNVIEKNAFSEVFLSSNHVQYAAHRGLSEVAPENTLAAFNMAGEVGFTALECDVQVTSDGAFVIHHDDTVDRMTNGSGRIDEKTLSDIRTLNIDSGINIDRFYPYLKIPTLEEYLDVCIKYNSLPIIEMKWTGNSDAVEPLLKVLKDKGVINRCLLMSFDYEKLSKARELHKTVFLGVLGGTITTENITYTKQLTNACLNIDKRNLKPEHVNLAHENGVKCGAWTINNRYEGNLFIQYGVDFLTTNILIPQKIG
ncbi:glycerophosphodiester phosphodiesterase family protein [Bacillus cereus group sp. BfR-BA-01451]|uniref:glycerophosphodiester phosphodiesterase n=1 Tax=Bacillus cereus group sp. BfR-BA-01451 TaxID=2920354 RepID=UPI001F567811|nr:glycerophosphodiester phosphodiesterase family protein [Bacillus cereus group sp. BfR-BA-01451]